MEFKYSEHAVERMVQRNINVDVIAQIMQKPDGVISQSLDKAIHYKTIKGRVDNMIAVVALGRVEILTVMNYFEVKK